MAFRGDIIALILGVLEAGPQHGYGIVKRLRDSGVANKLSEGQIYPYLHDLEESGLLVANWDTDTGAAPRKTYRLTDAGRRELAKHRETWRKFSEGVGSLLSGLALQSEANNG